MATTSLGTTRNAKAIALLPEVERAAWTELWADIEQLRKQTGDLIVAFQGTLTDTARQQVVEMKFEAGRTYIIDMKSTELDGYLKLRDPSGKLIAENNDISPTNLNSRIVFTASKDGAYRIVATSFEQRGTGAYTVTVREFARKAK